MKLRIYQRRLQSWKTSPRLDLLRVTWVKRVAKPRPRTHRQSDMWWRQGNAQVEVVGRLVVGR